MAELARQAADTGMSVRTIEERVRQLRPDAQAPADRSTMAGVRQAVDDPHVRSLEAELQRRMGTAVRIRVTTGKSGRIEIPFYNADDFDRVLELMLGKEEDRG
jgi:ParB family chromosome partitioning protein